MKTIEVHVRFCINVDSHVDESSIYATFDESSIEFKGGNPSKDLKFSMNEYETMEAVEVCK